MDIDIAAKIESPAIARFAHETVSDPEGALVALEGALTDAQGPLVERDADGALLVTFVFIGEATGVVVDSHAVMSQDGGERSGMQRVPGTNVWHHTIRPTDERLTVTYAFLVDSKTGLLSVNEINELAIDEAGHLEFAADRLLTSRHDPFNPDRLIMDGRQSFANDPEILALVDDPEELVRWQSVLTLPAGRAEVDFIIAAVANEPRLETFTIPSATWGDERTVTVHVPAGATSTAGFSTLFVLDGPGAVAFGHPQIMDALIERGDVRPTVSVYVHNKNSWSRSVEMVCNPKLVDQYADELIPWVREKYGVSEDPADVVVAGGSYGGLGSAFLSYSRPDVFGNVLSMSGAFWWGLRTMWGASPDSVLYGFDDEPEWLTRQISTASRTDSRFYLAVGALEGQHIPGGVSLLAANRHLRSVLLAKGYDVTYNEFAGGHDRAGWRKAFIDGLRTLLPTR